MTTLTQSTDTKTPFVTLAGDVVSGARDLAVVHGQQIRDEVVSQVGTATTSVAGLVVGAMLAILGLVFGLVALVQVLIQYANLTPAAAWGIVAGAMFVIGLVLFIVMWSAFKQLHVIPYKSLRSIEESLQWITRR